MSKFSFTSPDGQIFDILGPANATAAQARAIFDQQFNSGGLVGLRSGDAVNAVTQAADGLRSALSQVGLTLPSSAEQAFAGLKNVPLINPISAADFAKQAQPNFSLGPLNSLDLQGLMSQTTAQVGQQVDQVSATAGIGKFGLSLDKLETAGFVKPGTATAYARTSPPTVNQTDIAEAARINNEGGNITPDQVAKNRQLNSFLTPSVFTGKSGVSNLQTMLVNESVQNTIQESVLKQSYDLLTRTGVTQGLSTPQLGGLLQTASKFDIKTAVDFTKGLEVKNISEVLTVAKAGEYATSLVNRVTNIGQTGDITKLVGQLGNINSISDLGKLSSVLGSDLNGLASQLVGGLSGQLGNLGGLSGQLGNLGGLAGQLGNLGGLAGQLGNLGGLSNIASSLSGAAGGVVGIVSGLFGGGGGGSIYQSVKRPQGSINTVNRTTVDASIEAIIGNAKIPTPSFSPQSTETLAGLRKLKALSGLANISLKLLT
jgi:hypothetical protein